VVVVGGEAGGGGKVEELGGLGKGGFGQNGNARLLGFFQLGHHLLDAAGKFGVESGEELGVELGVAFKDGGDFRVHAEFVGFFPGPIGRIEDRLGGFLVGWFKHRRDKTTKSLG